jgi:hypothetical protein
MKKTFSVILALIFLLGLPLAALAQVPAPGGPFSSSFQVQNLDVAQTQCTYTLYDAAGNDAFTSAQTPIAAGDSLYVYVPDLALDDGMYSGVVMCDRKVAAVTNFSDADSGASHSGVADPATTWYAPGIYDNYYNYYSNIVVQNATDTPINVTVQIFAPGNSTPVYTYPVSNNVPAYSSVSFQQEGLSQLANNQSYSAKITGTGDVAVVVNIYGKGSVSSQLYSYNAFQSGSTKAYAPLIMHRYYGFNTSLTIQNMGGNPANVTVLYTNGVSNNYTIQPGAAEAIYTPGVPGIPAGNTLYGATITSNNNEPLAVLVNQSDANGRASSYVGAAAGSTEVRAPTVYRNFYTYESSITCQNVGNAGTTRRHLRVLPGERSSPEWSRA